MQAGQKYDVTRNQANNKFIVLNPQLPYVDGTNFTNLATASTTASGVVELLTNAELATGTDTTRAATAASILSLFGASTQASSGTIRIPAKVGSSFDEFIINFGSVSLGANTGSNITFNTAFSTSFLWGSTSVTSTNDT